MALFTSTTDVLQSRTSITADAAGEVTLEVLNSISIEMWVKVYGLTADARIRAILESTIDDTDQVWSTVKSIDIVATPALVTQLVSGPVGFTVGAVRADGDAYGKYVRVRISGLDSGGSETLDFEVKALNIYPGTEEELVGSTASYSLGAARIAVRAELQDDAGFIPESQLDDHIQRALRQINLDMPLTIVSDISGDGTKDLALPETYAKGYSSILQVEHLPDGSPQIPHRYLLEDDDWFVYEDPTQDAGEQLRIQFILSQPESGDKIRAWYTASYTLTEDASNLSPYAFEALVAGALRNAYTALASRFNSGTDPTINADSVDPSGRVQSYLYLRDKADKEYKARTGTDKGVAAAQVLAEFDKSWAHGEDFVWHPRILR